MPQFMKMLQGLDIFGHNIQFNIRGETQHRSSFGGFISLLTFLFFFLLFYRGFVDLIFMSQFKVSTQTIIDLNPDDQFLKEKFQFSVRVLGDTQDNRSLFNLTASQQIVSIMEDGTRMTNSKPIQLQACTLEHYKQINNFDLSKDMNHLNIQDYQCPSLGQGLNLTGIQSSSLHQYIKFEISQCQDLQVCYSYNEINNYMEENKIPYFKIQVAFSNFALYPYEEDTLRPYIDTSQEFIFVPKQSYPKVDIFLQSNSFYDKKSIMPSFQEFHPNKFYTVAYQNTKNQQILNNMINQTNQDAYAEINIGNFQEQIVVTKTYQSIDEFLAYAGGLMKIIIFVLGLLVTHYNKYGFYVQLANQLYIFNTPLRRKDGQTVFQYDNLVVTIKTYIQKVHHAVKKLRHGTKNVIHINRTLQYLGVQKDKERQNQEFSEIQSSKLDDIQNEIYHSRVKFLDHMFSCILSHQNAITMSFRYLVYRLFCRKLYYVENLEIKLIEKAINMVLVDCDIVQILEKLQEIDKLKQILLTNKQIRVFNFTPKPVVTAKKTGQVMTFQTNLGIQQNQLNDRQRHSVLNMPVNSQDKQKTLLLKKSKYQSLKSLNKLYMSYVHLNNQNDKMQDEQQKQLNNKLMSLIGEGLQQIFITSYQLTDDYKLITEQDVEDYKINEQFDQHRNILNQHTPHRANHQAIHMDPPLSEHKHSTHHGRMQKHLGSQLDQNPNPSLALIKEKGNQVVENDKDQISDENVVAQSLHTMIVFLSSKQRES